MTDQHKKTLLYLIESKGDCDGTMCTKKICPIYDICGDELEEDPTLIAVCVKVYIKEFGRDQAVLNLTEHLI